jgi:hypothetical protein
MSLFLYLPLYLPLWWALLLCQVTVTSLPIQRQKNGIGYIVVITLAKKTFGYIITDTEALQICIGYFVTITNEK